MTTSERAPWLSESSGPCCAPAREPMEPPAAVASVTPPPVSADAVEIDSRDVTRLLAASEITLDGAGRITLDGVDVRDIPQDNLRQIVGIALQEAVLFQGDVRFNVKFGQPDADDDLMIEAAQAAKAKGSTRFCMGAAWRNPTDKNLDKVIDMIAAVRELGMETCVTLGMLTGPQAERLKAAAAE